MSQTVSHALETQEHVRLCPVCKSLPRHWAVKRYGRDTYTIDRCSECGYAFVNPRPSLDFLKAHYRECGHGASSNLQTSESVIAAETLDPNSTIDAKRMIGTIRRLLAGQHDMSRQLLDVGAGYGFFSKEAITNGFKVVAMDLAENERQIARSISGIAPIQATFEDLDLAPSSMSVVLMSQVLEHALNVEAWISKAWRLLEPNGILAIALPNFGSLQRIILQESEPYICPPDHLNFFTPGALTKLLEKNGFTVEIIQHVSRVPKSTIRRRVPGIAAPMALPLWILANMTLRIIDFMCLGSIISVYGRKVSALSCAHLGDFRSY